MPITVFLAAVLWINATGQSQEPDHLAQEGADGPGLGKHVVLLAGDEEYRSEEALPMLAHLLAKHGFTCTTLFSLNADGVVDPEAQGSLSHSEALEEADAIVMALRFRAWGDQAMERFEDALLRGVSIVALRTSTHAFRFPDESQWARYSFRAGEETGWPGGFGREVLGETWLSHHGVHKVEGTRSVVEAANADHAVLNGVGEIFGDTDVYEAKPPEESSLILLRGQVTESLDPDSAPVAGAKNDPMQPIAWLRRYENEAGRTNRVFTTTMGSASDLRDADLRRLVVNAVFWGLGMEVPERADVEIEGQYDPSPYGFGGYKRGQRPEDFRIRPEPSPLEQGARVALIGGGLGSRMARHGHFETELHLRHPGSQLSIRNLCDEGNTPAFRPHAARRSQVGFPGGEALVAAHLGGGDLVEGVGHFETEEEWLERLEADVIVGFFGYSESFGGEEHRASFERELAAFARHTLRKPYNGVEPPRLALVSPIALEAESSPLEAPERKRVEENLARYAESIRRVADRFGVQFLDAYSASQKWYASTKQALTVDGAFLNEAGYRFFGAWLAEAMTGLASSSDEALRASVAEHVWWKNWYWINDFKMPNGVHAFGRRYNPFGPDNYPYEIRKLRELTAVRDRAIWAALAGEALDVAKLEAQTLELPPVPSNYALPNRESGEAGAIPPETASTFSLPEGYAVELWASEEGFPHLANPVQMSFDGKGRLWVAVMPSYPHYRAGDALPDDKLLIYEDTDGDGRADRETVWARGLHLPTGFELTPEGVFIGEERHLLRLRDMDGDGQADRREVVLSGFDDHDTHHKIGAFTADPSGAIIMGEGIFLRSHVETARGAARASDGGFFRFEPLSRRLERHAQLRIPNPWGVAYDAWGQPFFLFTSNPTVAWLTPGTVKPLYGVSMPGGKSIIEIEHRVRPTSGIEFLSSRHFPEEVQGDLLLCNTIGFRGIKQHQLIDEGEGYRAKFRQNLLQSSDPNFRPVDLEIAPDGSLYLIDWHNPLVGHMQHNARDPKRDRTHGRIYRITYPSRSLLDPAPISGASVEQLLEHLKAPEDRIRYRARRELRGREAEAVLPALKRWAQDLDPGHPDRERLMLEALWVSWGMGQIDEALLRRLLRAEDYRARAAAVRVLRHVGSDLQDYAELLRQAAGDANGRVSIEAVAAASWAEKEIGMRALQEVDKSGLALESERAVSFGYANARLQGKRYTAPGGGDLDSGLSGELLASFQRGAALYAKEGFCGTCHGEEGEGLPSSGFPPLGGSEWVTGSEERLIKLTLHGIYGPIEVKGVPYAGLTPMTPFGGLLDDRELADVLTFVRNAFGNRAPPVEAEDVTRVRRETVGRKDFYSADELLRDHPMMPE